MGIALLWCIFISWITIAPVFGLSPDTLTDSTSLDKKRFRAVYVGGAALYGVALAGLYEVWYKENARTQFHLFNDNAQWQQIDKVGHFYTGYHLSLASARIYQWTGMNTGKATWLGTATGLMLLTPIEILDGFSADYGASWGDVVANTAGSVLALQTLWWQQPRIHPKFSFHQTYASALRPNVLGENLPQQIIKDYNGQTYWLAFDIQPWLGKQSRFPAWLNLALGYGAENMVYARKNDNQAHGYHAYRQYYLSLDINLTRIPVKNKWIRSLFFALNTIHIPAPALEINKNGMKFHPVYF